MRFWNIVRVCGNPQLSILVFFSIYCSKFIISNGQKQDFEISFVKTINNCHYCIAIKTKLNKKFIVLCQFLLPKHHQIIHLSFVIVFHVKIQHKATNLSFCVVFASIKLPRHIIPINNYCLNDTIIILLLCCIFSWCWSYKSVTTDPYTHPPIY